MKKVLTLLLMFGLSFAAFAQMVDPVKFTAKLEMLKGDEAQIVFSGKIDNGWHVYSTELGNDGPISATFNAVKMDGVKTVGKLTPKGHEISEFDNMFGMKLRFFEGSVTFVQKIKFTKPEYSINCYLEYGACNDETCMPPTEVPFTGKGKSPAVAASAEKPKVADAAAPATEEKAEEVVAETTADTMAVAAIENDSVAAVASSDSDLYRPVINELKAYEDNPVDSSLFYIFLAGFAGGFLALLTPCVWPIIPMTVSFFLKRNKERSKAIREAVTYGISIVVIYVVLGLVVTLLFGASALNALSTNAIFNIFFCLLLVVFAASFFGAFEITLPSSWSNKIDEKSENTSGLLSIFLMAFTLTLVSFSCTGPIIGFLLVAVSSSGDIVAPTIGMLGFDSGSTHAMTLTAVDLDANGKATKWKVENSWGGDWGQKGCLIMTDRWFREYMFRLVVNKKYVSEKLLKDYNQKPIMVMPEDPLFQQDN